MNLSKYRISLGQFLPCTIYNSCRLLNEHKFVHILRHDTKAILWNVSRKNIGWSAKQCRMAYCKFEKLHFIVKQKQKLRLSYLANISSHHIEANLLLHRMHDIVHIFFISFHRSKHRKEHVAILFLQCIFNNLHRAKETFVIQHACRCHK